MVYVTGSITTTRSVATISPPMIVAAIEPNMGSNKRGISASTVVPDAVITGVSRSVAAFVAALCVDSPVPRSSFMRIRSITPLFTCMPTRPSKPSNEKKSNILPLMTKPTTTPINISGMVATIIIMSR